MLENPERIADACMMAVGKHDTKFGKCRIDRSICVRGRHTQYYGMKSFKFSLAMVPTAVQKQVV